MGTMTSMGIDQQRVAQVAEVMVFKTSVSNWEEVEQLRVVLDLVISAKGCWNFDLEDRDRVLRIERYHLSSAAVIALIRRSGFRCEELE